MKKIVFLILISALIVGCQQEEIEDPLKEECASIEGYMWCESMQECLEAGEECLISEITVEEAVEIAYESECLEQGELTGDNMYNQDTKTWWLDLDIEKEGCNPACVVSEATKTASINWRCTGLIPE